MEADSILQGLKAAIAASPCISESGVPVFVDYTRESEPCCGIFPAGEKKLFTDLAGGERCQYDFTIQMTGYGFQEKERIENERFAERFSRWSTSLKEGEIDLGEQRWFKSLWTGRGHLLYPAQDGQTFIYALEGSLVYQRKPADIQVRERWLFGFGSARERIWAECAAGIGQTQEEKAQSRWFYDFNGQKKKEEHGLGMIHFTGCFCPEDLFQQKVIGQNPEEEVLWVRCFCGTTAQESLAKGGVCTLHAQRRFASDPQTMDTIQIQMQLLTEQKGSFWWNGEGKGTFLPDRFDYQGGF